MQGVSSLQSVSAAGTPRSLWERQGIYDYDTFKLLYCGYLILFTFLNCIGIDITFENFTYRVFVIIFLDIFFKTLEY